VYLPAIDTIQLQIRNGNLLEGKGNARPLLANDHTIHGKTLWWIAQKIGAPRAGLFPASISTPQYTVSPHRSHRISRITAQQFAAADRCSLHTCNRPLLKGHKRHYEQETCARNPCVKSQIIRRRFNTIPLSEFGCLTEIYSHDNAKRQGSNMLSTSA